MDFQLAPPFALQCLDTPDQEVMAIHAGAFSRVPKMTPLRHWRWIPSLCKRYHASPARHCAEVSTARQPLSIEGMTGFVSSVEFSDGRVWIPSRPDLSDPQLQRVMAPSPEEQRLLQLHRKKGLNALVEELKKY